MKLRDSGYGMVLSVPGLIILLLWVLIPFSIVFIISFFRYDNMSPVVPIGLANYKTALKDPVLPLVLARTFIFSFGSTGLTLLTSVILALCLNRIVKGSAFFRSLVVMPWAVPLILSGFLWAWITRPLDPLVISS